MAAVTPNTGFPQVRSVGRWSDDTDALKLRYYKMVVATSGDTLVVPGGIIGTQLFRDDGVPLNAASKAAYSGNTVTFTLNAADVGGTNTLNLLVWTMG